MCWVLARLTRWAGKARKNVRNAENAKVAITMGYSLRLYFMQDVDTVYAQLRGYSLRLYFMQDVDTVYAQLRRGYFHQVDMI